MSFVSETMKLIAGTFVVVTLVSGTWWLVGALAGVAYQGFKFVTG